MKVCNQCNKKKTLDSFYKKKQGKNGVASICVECSKVNTLKSKRTIDGLISTNYSSQKYNSKKRKHNPPTYTKSKFKDWLLSQPNFKELYDAWVDSNYDKKLKPSVDRKDDYKGYSLDNIQLMTWEENKEKFRKEIISGTKKGQSKSVIQILNNKQITFHSAKEAERKTGVYNQNISAVCKGSRKTAGGFKWKYKL